MIPISKGVKMLLNQLPYMLKLGISYPVTSKSKAAQNLLIEYMTIYLSNYNNYFSLSNQCVIDQLTYFYYFKSFTTSALRK